MRDDLSTNLVRMFIFDVSCPLSLFIKKEEEDNALLMVLTIFFNP